jgi:hypothetical protein
MTSTLIKRRLASWAEQRQITIDKHGYAYRLSDNLFCGLCDETLSDFSNGSGNELDTSRGRSKMLALHSSSALACNVFEYWRSRDASPLGEALHLDTDILHFSFEAQLRTGISPARSNLDVLITLSDQSVIGVESKYLEPYSKHRGSIPQSYFAPGARNWAHHKLPSCHKIARDYAAGALKFRCLDVPQLLKHILALRNEYGHRFTLLYLWYDIGGELGLAHRAEIEQFRNCISGDVEFRDNTYQQLITTLSTLLPGNDYVAYLSARYGRSS